MAFSALKEKDVLKPVPKDEDPDDWPCHVLQQAVIFSQDSKSVVNLLEAELHGPFLVRGKLEKDKQYNSQFLCNPRGRIVEIDSDLFSIGDGPNGQVTIWAGGNAGWYEILPSANYMEEYENMAAAVKLYYSILDYITEARQSRKTNLDVDKIFDAYSAREHDSNLNREDVAELCRIHGVFLLSMMRRPATAKEWKTTSIFKWLVQELPEIVPQLEASSGRRTSQGAQALNARISPSPPSPKMAPDRMNSRKKGKALPIRESQEVNKVEKTEIDPSVYTSSRRPSSKGEDKEPLAMIDEEIGTGAQLRRSRRSGKGAALRLVTPRKRLRSTTLSDDDEVPLVISGKRRRSMAASVNDDEEDTPMGDAPEDPEDEGDNDEDEAVDENHLKEDEQPEEDIDVEEQLQLGLESVQMPSFEPCGPDGLWKCPRKGCNYFVHGVQEDAVQEDIRKHFLKHADNIKAQLARFKTVKQESRPHLPINHLLEKLRSLGEASRLQEEADAEKIDGKPVPRPIKRKALF